MRAPVGHTAKNFGGGLGRPAALPVELGGARGWAPTQGKYGDAAAAAAIPRSIPRRAGAAGEPRKLWRKFGALRLEPIDLLIGLPGGGGGGRR